MSYRYYILSKRVSKRIKLKEEYLQLFLPNLTYLEFIQVLEIFQAQFQGVYGGRKEVEKDFVELQTIKDKLTEISALYKFTTENISNKLEYLKNSEPTIILKDFHANIDSCKVLLNNTWINFSQEIDLLGKSIYNIKILSKIDNSLDSLRSQLKVLFLNLNNLKYSTPLNEVKKILEFTCKAALRFIKDKYTNLKHLFPNSFTVFRDTMSEEKRENASKDDGSLEECSKMAIDTKNSFDFLNCAEVEACTCGAPNVPDAQEAELCSISSSESTKHEVDEKNITQDYENQINQRKVILQQLMGDLLLYSREIARIENLIYTNEAKHEHQNEFYLKEKHLIENNMKLNFEEKQQKLKLLNCQINRQNEAAKEMEKTLEDNKVYIRKKARCQLKELKHLIKVFSLEHTRMMNYLEQFKLKAKCPIFIEQKIEALQKTFKCDMGRIREYNNKISNLYEGNEDISDKTTESETSSSLSKTSTSKEAELLEVVDVKNDDEMYLKHVLGKALVQGLAQITVVQPTDPIYYLANYLLHYRYNELSNLKKQVAFEELLIERDRSSKMKESTPICNPCKNEDKDPCK